MSLPLPQMLVAIGVVDALYTIATKVIVRAAVDFLQGDNQDWSYYAGLATGTGVAIATSRVGAIKFYATGQAVDIFVLKSPQGGRIKVYLNGVLDSIIDGRGASELWDTIAVALVGNLANEIRLEVEGWDTPSDPFWFALGSLGVVGGSLQEVNIMPYQVLNFRVKDSEVNNQLSTVPVYLPTETADTIVKIQTYVDEIALEIDAITGGVIESVDVTISLTLPGGLKSTADTGILNERGALLSFDTTGPRSDSVRIPAVKTTLMPGDDVATGDAAITALVTRLTTATTAAGIRPRTVQDYAFNALRSGKKSFRKQ